MRSDSLEAKIIVRLEPEPAYRRPGARDVREAYARLLELADCNTLGPKQARVKRLGLGHSSELWRKTSVAWTYQQQYTQ